MKELLSPPSPRDLPPARLNLRKEALMREIRKEHDQPTYRKRRRRIALVLVPALLLGAATTYVLRQPDEVVAAGIGCYDAPNDADSNVTIVGTTGADPVAVCRELWERADVGKSAGSAPPLVACVNSGGAVAVFPSEDEDLCSDLGLQPLPDGYGKAARAFVKMRDDLIREMYAKATAGPATERDACLSEDQSLEIARQVLSDHGFNDWTAELATGDYEGRECANDLAFDDKTKKVLIIPSSRGIDHNPFGPH